MFFFWQLLWREIRDHPAFPEFLVNLALLVWGDDPVPEEPMAFQGWVHHTYLLPTAPKCNVFLCDCVPLSSSYFSVGGIWQCQRDVRYPAGRADSLQVWCETALLQGSHHLENYSGKYTLSVFIIHLIIPPSPTLLNSCVPSWGSITQKLIRWSWRQTIPKSDIWREKERERERERERECLCRNLLIWEWLYFSRPCAETDCWTRWRERNATTGTRWPRTAALVSSRIVSP